MLNLQDPFVVHAERESGVIIVPAIDLYLPRFASKSSSRGVDFVGKNVLSFQDKNLVAFRLLGFGFGVGFFDAIANEKGQFIVNNNGDVELGLGFRSRSEFSLAQVPKDLSIGVKLFGSILFPKYKGFDVELERKLGRTGRRMERRVEWMMMMVEEIKVERAAKEGARPSEREEAKVSVVETGGEVGVAGDRWWW